MFWTDDPVADFHRHDAEQTKWLESRPECCECGNPIQSNECFEFNDELICPKCLKENHQKQTEDFCD